MNIMELKIVLLLSSVIGLLYQTKMVLTEIKIDTNNAIAMEKLYDDTFVSSVPTPTLRSTLTTNVSPEKTVKFKLFTRSNPNNTFILNIDDVDNLKASPFSRTRQTKVIIYGWLASSSDSWVINLREKYLLTGDYNVIIVEWYPLSKNEYIATVQITRSVGNYAGKFLKYLNTTANVLFSNIHILGHSLGAHIAGFAGATVSGAVGRITGMDPAGPLFEVPVLNDPKDRLDTTDAVFVDIIHTCAGIVGFVERVGHIDFYPNSGLAKQPGCSILQTVTCSHSRAHEFYIDSIIHPDGFRARSCHNWKSYQSGKCSNNSIAIMGENVSCDSRGVYYLKTNSQSPFSQG